MNQTKMYLVNFKRDRYSFKVAFYVSRNVRKPGNSEMI